MAWEVRPSELQILAAIIEKFYGWRPPGHQRNHWNLQGLCWKAPWAQVQSGEGKPSIMHIGTDTFWYQRSHDYHIHEWIKVHYELLLIIFPGTHRSSLSKRSLKSVKNSLNYRPWLKMHLAKRSRYWDLIMVGSMSVMIYCIYVPKLVFISNIQSPTLPSRTV